MSACANTAAISNDSVQVEQTKLVEPSCPTNQVEPVIRSVLLNIASVEVGELPKSSIMLVEIAPEFKDLYKQRRKKNVRRLNKGPT